LTSLSYRNIYFALLYGGMNVAVRLNKKRQQPQTGFMALGPALPFRAAISVCQRPMGETGYSMKKDPIFGRKFPAEGGVPPLITLAMLNCCSKFLN
jgi:hypothetical protein